MFISVKLAAHQPRTSSIPDCRQMQSSVEFIAHKLFMESAINKLKKNTGTNMSQNQ